jgi:GNAT superfamily N-acetyltransferase
VESINSAELTIHVESVDWDDAWAVALREALSAEMRLRYADRFAARVDVPAGMAVEADTVAYTAVAYTVDRLPVGHVALRWLGADLELKRMYVAPSHRGKGVSVALLTAVEHEAARLGAARIVLQTGDRQPDAVRLYEKSGYTRIPIFAPYKALTYSNCYQKLIPAQDGEL